MSSQVETTPRDYVASKQPHHRLLSLVGNTLQWAGAVYAVTAYGWGLLVPYVLLVIVFTYFIGIPPFINSLRCAQSYKGNQGALVATLAVQGIIAVAMILLLTSLRIGSMIPLFLVLGVVRALSMPRETLMQERLEVKSNQGNRDGAKIMYFRSIPDKRLGAPNWNEPWTPPVGFPRAKFFRKLKEVHPDLDDLDAAYLIEEAIYSFDDLPAKEPRRSQALHQRVDSEIKLYCSWSTPRVADWARNPGRTTGRNAFENDKWLLKRILDEQE
jgi:hypothetical protein